MKNLGKKRVFERLTVDAYMGCCGYPICACTCTCNSTPCNCGLSWITFAIQAVNYASLTSATASGQSSSTHNANARSFVGFGKAWPD
jgi:hypothetical protein